MWHHGKNSPEGNLSTAMNRMISRSQDGTSRLKEVNLSELAQVR